MLVCLWPAFRSAYTNSRKKYCVAPVVHVVFVSFFTSVIVSLHLIYLRKTTCHQLNLEYYISPVLKRYKSKADTNLSFFPIISPSVFVYYSYHYSTWSSHKIGFIQTDFYAYIIEALLDPTALRAILSLVSSVYVMMNFQSVPSSPFNFELIV